MWIQDKIRFLHRKYILKKYSENDDFRVPKNYNNTAVQFVDTKGLASSTKYLIWVDTKNFRVNIFTGSKNQWSLANSYTCSIGKPSTPTPLGTYKVGIKGYSFGQKKGYICYYYTQFKGNYLFHSIIYNLNNTVRDGRLGYKISDGCIRLAKANAKWIHDNIPAGTTVFIS